MARDRRDDNIFLLSDVYSEQLALEAEIISEKRDIYVSRLSVVSDEIINDMTCGKESCKLVYQTRKTKEEYLSLLTENRDRELRFGATLYGTHKDDIEIMLNGREARAFGSQGQQRSVALSMKIAEGELSREVSGTYPVFLFDDILSELDEKRREYLLSGIENKQVIITSCDKIDTPCKVYNVNNGVVD